MTAMMKGILFGVIVGIIGAAAWAAIAYGANVEIGWLAWGIGAAIGAAVSFGCGQSAGTNSGVIAALIAILSIVAGKYLSVTLMANREIDIDAMHQEELAKVSNDEYVISWIADEVAEEEEKAGRTLQWPAGMDRDEASQQSDYPPQVWAKAAATWQQMTADQKQQHRADVTESINMGRENLVHLKAQIIRQAFKESFGALDIVFFLLGAATAWGLGQTPRGTTPPAPANPA